MNRLPGSWYEDALEPKWLELTEDQEALGEVCGILRQLRKASDGHWKERTTVLGEALGEETYSGYLKLINKFPPIEFPRLNRILHVSPKSRDLSLRIEEGCFYLPPLPQKSSHGDASFVVTLSVECKLVERSMNMRIEMHRVKDDALHGIGYRFELGAGQHAYCHVTLTNKRATGEPLARCPDWLPTSIPRTPASAKCSVSMIVCILLALYGKGGYRKLQSEGVEVDGKYLVALEHILKA